MVIRCWSGVIGVGFGLVANVAFIVSILYRISVAKSTGILKKVQIVLWPQFMP